MGQNEERLPHPKRDPGQLSEDSWELIDEALYYGTMTLRGGKSINLDAGSIIDLAKWMATSKAKKPRLVGAPEDFKPKDTTGEQEDGE